MPTVDGLPAASAVSFLDMIQIDQGGIAGRPGTAVSRKTTLASIFGAAPGAAYLPLIGGTVTGSINLSRSTWSGGNPTANAIIYADTTWTGTNTTGVDTSIMWFRFQDHINAGTGPGSGFNGIHIDIISAGASKIGQTNVFDGHVLVNATTGNTRASGNQGAYGSGRFTSEANVNDGGAGTDATTYWGGLYGINPVATLYSGATFWSGLTSAEFDYGAKAGSSMLDKIGISVVTTAGDRVQGVRDDMMLALASQEIQGVGGGVREGITFGRRGGGFPIATTGTMISAVAAGPLVAARGIDFSAVTFTGFAFLSPNFALDGAGNTFVNSIRSFNSGSISVTANTGAPLLSITSAASPVNYPQTIASATGAPVTFAAVGADAALGLDFKTAPGNGDFRFLNTANNIEARIAGVASAVSHPLLRAAAAGANPAILAGGTAANLVLATAGAITAASATGFPVMPTVSATPTGTAPAGAFAYDPAAHKWWISEGGGVWKGVVLS